MPTTLISSPLQGFTDFRFRNEHYRYFEGIDTYYAPYIRFNGKPIIKPGYQRDLQPVHNDVPHLVPQVMTNKAEEFLLAAEYVASLGYDELNWNLGCPYPMVTNKGLGSGLISDTARIETLLDEIHAHTSVTVSMKMRLGYASSTEILEAFKILDKYPLGSIGIHARLGCQLYVGGVDLDGFERCIGSTRHKLYYNGDITTVSFFRNLTARFPSIGHFMIGRGLIADPFLPMMIKLDQEAYPEDRWDIFSKYLNKLQTACEQKLTGDKAVIRKMLSYWEYMSQGFDHPQKVIKQIKKTKTLEQYEDAVNDILHRARMQEGMVI